MSDTLTIAMNLKEQAPSQYVGYPFDSVVSFKGKLVFFGESGVFEEGGGLLNATPISAWIDLPLHDFGAREQKSIEAVDVGYEAPAGVTVTLTPDEETAYAREITLPPVKAGSVQQDSMVTLRKVAHGKARYWGVRVANIAGGDFSLDFLALAPVVLKRRSR